jgi:hypothetical protein
LRLTQAGCTLAQFKEVAVKVLSADTVAIKVSNSVNKGQGRKTSVERAIRDASIFRADLGSDTIRFQIYWFEMFTG